MTVLSAVGVAGLLGFGLNSGAAVRSAIGLPTTALSPLTSASAAAVRTRVTTCCSARSA